MLRITEPFAGIFMVEGATTENSIGLDVSYCGVVAPLVSPLEEEPLLAFSRTLMEAGPQITADCLAKVNSISISEVPLFLKGKRNFYAALPV